MARRDTLRTLQLLAEYAQAEQSRHLAERMRALTQEEQRLGQITGYLAEYDQQSRAAQEPTSLGALRGRRSFVERLRSAVVQQHGLVEAQRFQVDQHLRTWREARARALAMQRLGERIDAADQEERDRREQVSLDEIGLALRARTGER